MWYLLAWIFPLLFVALYDFNLAYVYLLFSWETAFFLSVSLDKQYKIGLFGCVTAIALAIAVVYGHLCFMFLSYIWLFRQSVSIYELFSQPGQLVEAIFHVLKFLYVLEPLYPKTQAWQITSVIFLVPFCFGVVIFPLFLFHKGSFLVRANMYTAMVCSIVSFVLLGLTLLTVVLYEIYHPKYQCNLYKRGQNFEIQYYGDIRLAKTKFLIEKERIVLIPENSWMQTIEVRNEVDGSLILPEQLITKGQPVTFIVSERELKHASQKAGFISREITVRVDSIMCAALVILRASSVKTSQGLLENVRWDGRIKEMEQVKYTIRVHMEKNTFLESIPKYSEAYENIPTEDVFEYSSDKLLQPEIKIHYITFPLTLPRMIVKIISRPLSDILWVIISAIIAPSALLLWFRSQIFKGIKKIFSRRKRYIGFRQK